MRMSMRMLSWGIGGILASVMGVNASERRFALGLTAMRRFFGSVQVLDWPVLGRPQRSLSPDPKALGASNCLLDSLKAFESRLGDRLGRPTVCQQVLLHASAAPPAGHALTRVTCGSV